MKLTYLVPLLASLIFSASHVNAAHIWEGPGDWAHGVVTYDHKTLPLYSANELSVDLGVSYTAGERGLEHLFKTSIKGNRGEWGGDVGLNYFFTREFGISVDANLPDNGGNLVDAVLGNLIARLPLGNSGFAPYVFGGGGRTTDRNWDWTGQAGVGLEFRLSRNFGLYTDGRYLWPQHRTDGLLLRAGLRIVF